MDCGYRQIDLNSIRCDSATPLPAARPADRSSVSPANVQSIRSYLSMLECARCAKTYSPHALRGTCDCGAPLLCRYDLDALRRDVEPGDLKGRPATLWRYAELLPVQQPERAVTLGEGFTPLVSLQWGERHGLRDYFQLVVCGDTLPAKKPDPLPVMHCLKRFAVDAQRAVFVGDSEIDVKTARAAGVASWCVPYGYNHGRPIASAKPDRVIDSFAELVEQPERRLLLIH